MAVCVLLPEAESWLAQQEDIELPQPPPRAVRKKKAQTTLHPILVKERKCFSAKPGWHETGITPTLPIIETIAGGVEARSKKLTDGRSEC